MRPPEDEVLLRDMLDHARKAVAATQGKTRSDLGNDGVLAAALERFIEVIGEAASKVSEAARFELESVPWHEIVGMRNRLVHSYAAVDHDIIWAVATADPPALATDLEAGVDERT